MSVILLVRHGQASWGAEDYDQLSDLGVEQSRVLGTALAARGVRPELLLVGRMRRHRQTADAAVEGAGWTGGAAEVVLDQAWDEFDHRQMLARHPDGIDDSLDRDEFQRRFEEATRRWTDGEADDYDESFAAFGARVEAGLANLAQRLGRRGTAVVLTSGGPISWATTALLRGDAPLWRSLNPVCVNAAVTKVVLGRRGSTLVSFNDHSHLEDEGARRGTDLVSYR